MTLLYTPNYHIGYLAPSTPLVELATATQQNAESLDAAMGRAGYTPPDASTFAALAARVAALDTPPAPVALTLTAPFAQYSVDRTPLRAWATAKTGHMVGFLTASTSTGTGDKPLATLPAALRPVDYTVSAPVVINGNPAGRCDIAPSGAVTLSLIAALAPSSWAAINMVWPLS